jgi:ribonuclease BN (tRNA processing enzyme)
VNFTVVGCSPAWPNPGGAQSGYLLENSQRLLLDCGPGVLARLRERWEWPEVDAIALTHWHLDHWGDIVPWVWGQTLGPGNGVKKAELWVPPGGIDALTQIASRIGRPGMFADAFDLRQYDEHGFEAAGFLVEPHRVLHYDLLAYGFRASANGRTIAYSGDSGPSEALPDLARGADLFVCEATLLRPNPEGGIRGHLSADEAVEAFEEAGARRLLITHRPVERPLDTSLEQAYDGMKLEL